MDFATAVVTCFRNYATFGGRARRSEFWWFALFNFGVLLILGAIDTGFGDPHRMLAPGEGVSPVGMIYWLAVFLPSLAVTVRRLHDTDRTGWWVLLQFVPVIGPLILIWFLASRGTAGPNRFGPDPLRSPPPDSDRFAPSPLPRVPRR